MSSSSSSEKEKEYVTIQEDEWDITEKSVQD